MFLCRLRLRYLRVYLIELKVKRQLIGFSGSDIKFPFWFCRIRDYGVTTNKKASDEACLYYLIKEFFNAIQLSFVCWEEE